ncbi:MAG: TRAP transporter small permease [Candidatus Adiutrix sp.]|jgi:TRAP-type C4-dicarboxylate transport system permease small subunit|nr:TRAP transporter small permease [Candidatus Adiutrix sp.]
MRYLKHFYDNLEEYFCEVLIGVMIFALSLQVIVRMTTGGAVSWAEELSRYCFIWGIYIGASLAAKKAAHVRVTAQFIYASTRTRLFFRILADAVWLGFNIFFLYYTATAVRESFRYPEVTATMGVVKAYIELIVPIGFAMMSWRTVELYIRHWRRGTLASLVETL